MKNQTLLYIKTKYYKMLNVVSHVPGGTIPTHSNAQYPHHPIVRSSGKYTTLFNIKLFFLGLRNQLRHL